MFAQPVNTKNLSSTYAKLKKTWLKLSDFDSVHENYTKSIENKENTPPILAAVHTVAFIDVAVLKMKKQAEKAESLTEEKIKEQMEIIRSAWDKHNILSACSLLKINYSDFSANNRQLLNSILIKAKANNTPAQSPTP